MDGVFVRDLPASEMELLLKDAEQRLNDEDKTFIEDLFHKLICDEKGEQFEDLVDQPYDVIMHVVPMNMLMTILAAIPKAVNPTGVDLGN